MGKLADAIKDRRKGRQRRLGFGAAAEAPPPSMVVGTIGAVDGADFWLALSAQDAESIEAAVSSSEVGFWGQRLDALTVDQVAAAKERGAAFVSFELDGARADAMLDEDLDYVVRLSDLGIDETAARALGSLRPAEIAVEVELPVSLESVLALRRLAMLVSTPLGVKCTGDISAGDLEALRDSGVAVLALAPGTTQEEINALKQRIVDIPERKSKRGDDAHPLIPTTRTGGDDTSDDD